MRSELDNEDQIRALTTEQRRLQEALAIVQDELSRLRIAKKRTPNLAPLATSHPIGQRVTIINRRDPAGLHKATATITGHTRARIKICVNNTEYLRAASSLELLKDE